MATRLPVDCLVDELDNIPSTSGTQQTQPNIRNNASNNSQQVQVMPDSPRTVSRRLRQTTRNLSSSSLRRRLHKPTHCHYCQRYRFNRQQLESHLEESELCLNLYMREHKVNELLGH